MMIPTGFRMITTIYSPQKNKKRTRFFFEKELKRKRDKEKKKIVPLVE